MCDEDEISTAILQVPVVESNVEAAILFRERPFTRSTGTRGPLNVKASIPSYYYIKKFGLFIYLFIY